MTVQKLEFRWAATPEPSELLAGWQAIAAQAKPSLFLSVDWLAAWLNSYGRPDWLLTVYNNEELIGIAFFCERSHKRPLGINARTLHLNHAGCESRDQIWPEYNQVICLPAYREQIEKELVAATFEYHQQINELDTGLAELSFVKQINTTGFIAEQALAVASFAYDENESSFTKVFSKNLKSEISRTERGLAENGPFEIQIMETPEQVWQQFKAMAPLHQAAWGVTSGFLNPDFMSFHEALIMQSNTALKPIVMNLLLKDEPEKIQCSHYLLLQNGIAYFYLGVTNKTLGARIKAGTYLHAKAIEQLKQLGCTRYDFLGGDNRYKRRMSNKVVLMAQYRIKRNLLKFKVEQVLKGLKTKLERKRA